MKLDDGLSELLNVQIVLGPCLMLHFEFTEFGMGPDQNIGESSVSMI